MTNSRVFMIGFPGEIAKNTAKRLANSFGSRVQILVTPEQLAAYEDFASEEACQIELVEGSEKKIDFGLSGTAYNALAQEITAIAYFPLPGPLKTISLKPDTRAVIREIIELGLAAPHLRHIVVLSHLDVAGTLNGTFAERDLDLGQKFSDPAEDDRFRVERILRRFARALPITIVRSGWIVGEGELLCPLILLLLAADEQNLAAGKGSPNLLHFVDKDCLETILANLTQSSPIEDTNILHITFSALPALAELVAKVRELAAQFAPLGFDLVAGARRVLRRAEPQKTWSVKEFFRKQPSTARILTAHSEKVLKERGLPIPELSDALLEQLVSQAMEQVIGYK